MSRCLSLVFLSLPLWAQTGRTGRECSSEAAQTLEKDVTASSKEAQQVGPAGAVVLVGVVDESGRACGNWTIVRSRGSKLHEVAFARVSQRQYTPGRKNGIPIPVKVSFEVVVKTD